MSTHTPLRPLYCALCDDEVPAFCSDLSRCSSHQRRQGRPPMADPDGNARPWVYAFWSVVLAGVVMLLLAVVWR